MKTINIKAVITSEYDEPCYATEGSAGCDLKANIPECITIKAHNMALIPTGLHIQLPEGYEAQIRSRSGMTLKHGIVVANGIGTIDSDYTGEIKVILYNLTSEDYVIKPGERIAQMVISEYVRAEFSKVDEIKPTLRGEGGFGHTGK